jgi:hypothetical protein
MVAPSTTLLAGCHTTTRVLLLAYFAFFLARPVVAALASRAKIAWPLENLAELLDDILGPQTYLLGLDDLQEDHEVDLVAPPPLLLVYRYA